MCEGWLANFFISPKLVPSKGSSPSAGAAFFLGLRTLALYTSSERMGFGWLRPPRGLGSVYLQSAHASVMHLTVSHKPRA